MMILVFGIWLNASNMDTMKTIYGQCWIWTNGRKDPSILFRDHNCDEIAKEIKRQLSKQ